MATQVFPEGVWPRLSDALRHHWFFLRVFFKYPPCLAPVSIYYRPVFVMLIASRDLRIAFNPSFLATSQPCRCRLSLGHLFLFNIVSFHIVTRYGFCPFWRQLWIVVLCTASTNDHHVLGCIYLSLCKIDRLSLVYMEKLAKAMNLEEVQIQWGAPGSSYWLSSWEVRLAIHCYACPCTQRGVIAIPLVLIVDS